MTITKGVFGILAVFQALAALCMLPLMLAISDGVPNPDPLGSLFFWGIPAAMVILATLSIWLLQRENTASMRAGMAVALVSPLAIAIYVFVHG